MFVPNLPTLVLCSSQIYLLFLRSNLPNYRVILVPIIVLRSSQLSCYVRPNYRATFVPTIVLLLCLSQTIMRHSFQLSCYIRPNYRATTFRIYQTIVLRQFQLSCYVHSYYRATNYHTTFIPTIMICLTQLLLRSNYCTMFVPTIELCSSTIVLVPTIILRSF
jgi:hypothetical protein